MTLPQVSLPVPTPRPTGPGVVTRDEEEQSFSAQCPQYFDLSLALAHKTPAVLSSLQDVQLVQLRTLGIGVVEMTLLHVMVELTRSGQTVPSWPVLSARIRNKIESINAAFVPEIDSVVARLISLQVDPARDTGIVVKFTGWIRRELSVRPAAVQAMRDVADGRKTVEQLSADMNRLKAQENPIRTRSNPFSYAEAFEGESMSTGLPWFDELLGGTGGLLRGSGYSCLACTGGGKTTLAHQLGLSFARMGRRVLMFTTEQTFKERYLINKLWSCFTGLPFERFQRLRGAEQPPDDLVSPEVKQKLEHLLTNNIWYYDFQTTPGSLEEIDNLAHHHKPDLIVVDWAGTLANQLMDNGKYDDMQLATSAVADYMRNAAVRHSCATLTLHQIAASMGTNPFRHYDHTMAKDCKSFSVNMAFGLVMTPPDKNKVFQIKVTKCRYGVGKEQFVRIDPHVSRIVPIDGVVRKGRGGNWQAGDAGTIPENTKPRARSDGGFAGA